MPDNVTTLGAESVRAAVAQKHPGVVLFLWWGVNGFPWEVVLEDRRFHVQGSRGRQQKERLQESRVFPSRELGRGRAGIWGARFS